MNGDRLKRAEVNLSRIGWVKFRQSRDIPDGGVIKQARIVKREPHFFLGMVGGDM